MMNAECRMKKRQACQRGYEPQPTFHAPRSREVKREEERNRIQLFPVFILHSAF
jgi:hypothetical protein